ncbi:hypothetical protein JOL62DRAFT_628635 [Phyllosticta paracitricarpa]|uniref:Uncharacterized protein n=1 Tax=Phyllosticta paracitricarpa TaxID=2016321 RepID=A0ABR1MX35_9PEZI
MYHRTPSKPPGGKTRRSGMLIYIYHDGTPPSIFEQLKPLLDLDTTGYARVTSLGPDKNRAAGPKFVLNRDGYAHQPLSQALFGLPEARLTAIPRALYADAVVYRNNISRFQNNTTSLEHEYEEFVHSHGSLVRGTSFATEHSALLNLGSFLPRGASKGEGKMTKKGIKEQVMRVRMSTHNGGSEWAANGTVVLVTRLEGRKEGL